MSAGGAEPEDLESNPLYRFLQSSRLLEAAVDKRLLICVPAAASLAQSVINKDFAQTHLVQVTGEPPHASYRTLTGKQLLLGVDKTITTGSGFPAPPRRVGILCQELYYNEQFQSTQLLRLALPLVGKVPAAYLAALQQQEEGLSAVPLERRSLGEHEAVIQRVLGQPLAAVRPAALPACCCLLRSFWL